VELFQTPVPVPTLVILALFALPAAGQQREKQTGNSNRTLKMMGLETLYGVMCLVNKDVFFFFSKAKPSMLLVTLGCVCKLVVVGFSSLLPFPISSRPLRKVLILKCYCSVLP